MSKGNRSSTWDVDTVAGRWNLVQRMQILYLGGIYCTWEVDPCPREANILPGGRHFIWEMDPYLRKAVPLPGNGILYLDGRSLSKGRRSSTWVVDIVPGR